MLTAITQRLEGKAGLALVGAAAGLATVGTPPVTPAAFVFPIRDRAKRSRVLTGHEQPVKATVGVLLVLDTGGDPHGGLARDVAMQMRDAINDELAGWQPVGADAPIDYAGGALAEVRPNEIRWLLRYRLRFRLWR